MHIVGNAHEIFGIFDALLILRAQALVFRASLDRYDVERLC
jgi:hypothetical protein